MVEKIFKLFTMKDGKKDYSYEYAGETLWTAICDGGYGSYDAPIISDWYHDQYDYIVEEWYRKQDFLSYLLHKDDIEYILDSIEVEYNEHFIQLIEPYFEGWQNDECCVLMETKLELFKVDKIQYDIVKEPFNRIKIRGIINKIFDYFDNKFEEWVWERTYDDFNCHISDINYEETDEELAGFFGYQVEMGGYKIDGEEHDLSELYICPNCEEPNLKEKVKEIWDMFVDNGYPRENKYCCYDCETEYDWDDKKVHEINKHISEEEWIARLI